MAQKQRSTGWLIQTTRRSGQKVWEFCHYEKRADGRQAIRKQVIGTSEEFPTRAAADKSQAVARIRLGLNFDSLSMTMSELIAQYRKHGMGKLSYSTKDRLEHYLLQRIEPRWAKERVMKITTKQVQSWLDGLTARCKLCKHLTLDKAAQCNGENNDGVHPPLAPSSKCKIRNTMHSLYVHAISQGFFGTNSMTGEQIAYNPIRGPFKGAGVHQSSQRVKQPVVLSDEELNSLLIALPHRERTLVRLANLGLRRSELQGLQWSDFDFEKNRIHVNRGVVDNHVGKAKTEASAASVPMDIATKQDLLTWMAMSEFRQPNDYVFSSSRGKSFWLSQIWRTNGKKVAKMHTGKNVGLHSFRHTFATRVIKVVPKENAKTAQALLRHANFQTTMNLYAQADETLKAAAVDALSLPLATEAIQ